MNFMFYFALCILFLHTFHLILLPYEVGIIVPVLKFRGLDKGTGPHPQVVSGGARI